ncbi:FAD-binding PCMH-type domain-containing protein [Aphelenchoides besseyi]|nr:FAD-binding PCMH-type domain-containing protein [Aphelenchoides besseyi]
MGSKTAIPMSERILEWVLFRFRWIFVILFVLPASVIYDQYFALRNWLVFKLNSAPKAHDRKVAIIQKQIRDWNDNGRQQKLCTARAGFLTMSFRFPKYKKNMLGIKTDQLVDILEIDKQNETIRVEPMVTMGHLTRLLLPHGYTLPIVPELDDLTVGGMVNGCGVESSSKKYGLFQHICVQYEVVTANGELVVTRKENSEHNSLFYGIPWSHGTLGFLVAVTIRIISCKPFVKLTYNPVFGSDVTERLREAAVSTENEFVEGIAYSPESAVIMTGEFSDSPPKNAKVNAIGRWYKPWFFKHVENILINKESVTEYIPLRHFYHRHSKSIFWELQDLIPFGNNPIYRYLLGWALPPKVSLLKLTTPKPIRNLYDRHHVIQDLLIPLTHLNDAVKLIDEEIGVYPLWLCPFKLPSYPGLIRNRSGADLIFIDVGIYGNAERKHYDARESTRKLEKFVRDAQGAQMLYADTYMNAAEFWTMFDSTLYDWLRIQYDCKTAFPDVFEKVCREARE